MSNYLLTKAEYEVLEALWEFPQPVRTRHLLGRMLEKGKEWKRQTLNTLLFRLEEKGVIARRHGQVYSYMTQCELMQKQTKEILDNLYGGKIENFCAALAGTQKLPEEELKKLRELLDGWGKQ